MSVSAQRNTPTNEHSAHAVGLTETRVVLDQLRDYTRIQRAIEYLDERYRSQPQLSDVAGAIGLSEYHFQRLFRRWAGVSPKRFLQCLTVEHAKTALLQGHSVLHAAIDAGLSGPSRLHDHFVSLEGMTPGEYGTGGEHLTISYGIHASPFGWCFMAATDRGLCRIEFVDEADDVRPLAVIEAEWPAATLEHDPDATGAVASQIFEPHSEATEPIKLAVTGTNFQVQVWRALLRVPPGCLVSYQSIAGAIGRRGAERAVGRAVGQNPIAYLIPCHRAIRKSGVLGNYRWGASRKKAILGWEATQAQLPAAS